MGMNLALRRLSNTRLLVICALFPVVVTVLVAGVYARYFSNDTGVVSFTGELFSVTGLHLLLLVLLVSIVSVLGCVFAALLTAPSASRADSQNNFAEQVSDESSFARQDLQERVHVLEAALEYMDQGMTVFDADLNLVVFNNRFLELQDIPLDFPFLGMPMEAFFRHNAEQGEYGPGDVEQQVRERLELAAQFKPHRFERTKIDGTVMEIVGNLMPDGGFVTTYSDITDHKQAEHALRQSEQRFKALYHDNPSMFFTLDSAGQILSVNRYGANQLGYSVDDLVGKTIMDLSPAAESAQVKLHLDSCLADTEKVNRWEVVKYRQDGSSMWVREVARVVVDDEGQTRIMTVCEDITRARKLSDQLSHQASHDRLTGLFNRWAFEQRIEHALEENELRQLEASVFFIDLDRFKIINDTCGHVAGDEFLRQVGGILLGCVRKSDTVARIGGDEFGVLLENCPPQKARRVADSILKKVEAFRFAWEDNLFSSGASIGIVSVSGKGQSISSVLAAADAACYVAKDAGRNRLHVFHEKDSMVAARKGEVQWLTRTQEALSEDRFCLYYQTIEPAPDAPQELHYEVLLRMSGSKGEVIPPGAFLPAAERYNLMPSLDRWVIKSTLAQLGSHPQHLAALSVCSINLSGQSLTDEGFDEFIIECLKQNSIPAEKICFEITETAVIRNLAAALQIIKKLKEIGCLFALDDFGSGLSSFAYLKTLPVDYLKIDGIFIKDIMNSPIDRAMVRSINEIGHVMGKKTVAEFVENQEIQDFLLSIGVDYCQGYHLSQPRPFEELLFVRNAALG